ncbi:hypothetical protein PTSG_00971 [Salpingoeca rosetta]|uniref:MOCS2A n=1 Tax=Salpingoeca rosetta (strain ATCC 50818 / BSB-021) TaxID=946362 RepID=F2TY09_SALR5|nr:uncharacterized protein PTSG_00971 [Salpingoeca rosetta]EGD76268.1 hypothetical protein PTSG_00971 [Salpingoeca rosetta]|eukprot:XP_004998443.1 hypothetical protein PTSG_00971 [Salpingoeca rosetta]
MMTTRADTGSSGDGDGSGDGSGEGGVQVTVLLFAECRERSGQTETTLDLPHANTTATHILQAIAAKFPSLEPVLGTVVLAVNEEYVEKDAKLELKPSDTIALIPPISGIISESCLLPTVTLLWCDGMAWYDMTRAG